MDPRGSVNSTIERAFGRKSARRLRGTSAGPLPSAARLRHHRRRPQRHHPPAGSAQRPSQCARGPRRDALLRHASLHLRPRLVPAALPRQQGPPRRPTTQGLHPVLTGESSPSYLAHPNVPTRLARALPRGEAAGAPARSGPARGLALGLVPAAVRRDALVSRGRGGGDRPARRQRRHPHPAGQARQRSTGRASRDLPAAARALAHPLRGRAADGHPERALVRRPAGRHGRGL